MSRRSIVLKVPLSPLSGYGNDGLGITEQLEVLGLDVHVWPTVTEPPIPIRVAQMLTKEPLRHYDFLIHHVDPANLGIKEHEASIADVTAAWSMWEFDAFGDEPWEKTFAERIKHYDVLLPYDTLTRDLFAKYSREGQRIEMLQGGYDPAGWSRQQDLRGGSFKYGMVGQLHNRKNPWAAINAFKALKDKHGDAFDAELHLKTTVKSLHPQIEQWCPGLHVHYEVWPPDQLRWFYSGLDVLVAPSWGEGKNLPALEAGTMGVPTIVSACSGHMMWADDAWSFIVDGEMQEVTPGVRGLVVDQAGLEEAMWYAYMHRQETAMRGRAAAAAFPAMRAWPVVLQRLLQVLETT